MTTNEILEAIRKIDLMKNAVNEETGVFLYTDEDIKKQYELIESTKEEKLNAIEDYKRKLKKDIEFFDDKKKKQESNIKKANASIEYMKTLQVLLLDNKPLKTDEYTYSFKTTKNAKVTDEELLQDKYFKIERKPILKDIKEAIELAAKNEESFFGAVIESKISFSVR